MAAVGRVQGVRRRTALAILVGFAAGGLAGLAATSASSQSFIQSPLNNLIDVLVIDRELLAFDALGTKNFRVRLELDEDVIWSGAQGLVGVVLTTRRALAATPVASQWQEVRWRAIEVPANSAEVSDRLALLATDKRVLAFDSVGALWVESSIGPRERVTTLRAGQNSGVVVTNRRALGIAPDAHGFFHTNLRLHEDIERVNADANLATIMTSQRILVFRGEVGSWSEVDRRIHR
jgi:hypothetical protein